MKEDRKLKAEIRALGWFAAPLFNPGNPLSVHPIYFIMHQWLISYLGLMVAAQRLPALCLLSAKRLSSAL